MHDNRTTHELERFEATDDSGRTFTIIRQESFDFSVPGLKFYALSTGEDVNALKDGTFEILDTKKILRRKVGATSEAAFTSGSPSVPST